MPEESPESSPASIQEEQASTLVSGPERVRTPWRPFVAYGVAWVIFAAATVVLLGDVPREATIVGQPEYPGVLLAGTVLALMGPLVALLVWGATWYRARRRSGSIFASSVLRAAIVLLFGVALWWAALTYVDVLRLERI